MVAPIRKHEGLLAPRVKATGGVSFSACSSLCSVTKSYLKSRNALNAQLHPVSSISYGHINEAIIE